VSNEAQRHYGLFIVTISADGFPDVVALLDAQPPQVTGGQGGWTTVARQRKLALTQWQGNDPLRLSVPIIFDAVAIDNIAKQKICMVTLGKMGRPHKGAGEPPIVHIDGPGDILDPTGKGVKEEWVIENLQWGTNVRRERVVDGWGQLRQDVVVNLIEYIDEDRVAFANLPAISKHRHKRDKKKKKKNTPDGGTARGKNTHGWPKWYHPKPGDTLPKIAAKFYGDSSMWHRIAKANNMRDPSPPPGMMPWILLIPAP
jgi:hypothetical protein